MEDEKKSYHWLRYLVGGGVGILMGVMFPFIIPYSSVTPFRLEPFQEENIEVLRGHREGRDPLFVRDLADTTEAGREYVNLYSHLLSIDNKYDRNLARARLKHLVFGDKK